MQNNPFIAKYNKPATPAKRMEYEKAVRKTFPDLKELDGVAISSNLPLAPKPNHVPAQFAGLVTAFVTKYLAALNEPNRPNLRFAFFERSMFSLTIMLGGADRFHKTYESDNSAPPPSNPFFFFVGWFNQCYEVLRPIQWV